MQMYLMDLHTGKWQDESLPSLNQGRCFHSSLGIRDQVYVACGENSDGEMSSVEMLRLGAEAWDLIEIPDFTQRIRPILSKIDSKNICILGGMGPM